jgi:Holliday junction resolvase-like predicted endonuclease|tara:strand:+ start:16124 stop:16435 length:312 start_codon:yes stop_codon:yes gene_type:complete
MAEISKVRLGIIAEHYAIQWLLNQGHQVFYNTVHTGPIDIVILEKDKLIPIDVKVVSLRKNKNLLECQRKVFRSPNARQKELGVRILNVDLVNNLCYWNENSV